MWQAELGAQWTLSTFGGETALGLMSMRAGSQMISKIVRFSWAAGGIPDRNRRAGI